MSEATLTELALGSVTAETSEQTAILTKVTSVTTVYGCFLDEVAKLEL